MTIRPFNNKEEIKAFDKEIRELMFGSVNEKIEELNNMVSKPIKIKRRKMKVKEYLLNQNLIKIVYDFKIKEQVLNCFRNEGIESFGDLVQKTERELLRIPNFGKKSLIEIKKLLSTMSLYLGMKIIDKEIIYKSDLKDVVCLKKLLFNNKNILKNVHNNTLAIEYLINNFKYKNKKEEDEK
jgi:hypothetical protein